MTHRNFSIALLFINEGDKRDEAFFCQEFDTMAEALREAKRNLRENHEYGKPGDAYLVTLYDPQKDEFTCDLFTLTYDGKDYAEELCTNH